MTRTPSPARLDGYLRAAEWLRDQPRPYGECHACHAETSAEADTFCVACWRKVSEADRLTYLKLWRALDVPALHRFVQELIPRIR